MTRRRGPLAALLGIERPEPPVPEHAEIDLANGDVVRLDDGRARLVEVLARLDDGLRVCALSDGVRSELVVLDRRGGFWRFAPCDNDDGTLVAEAFCDDQEALWDNQMVAVRRTGTRVTVTGTRQPPLGVDLASPPRLGATWLGRFVGPDGPGEQL